MSDDYFTWTMAMPVDTLSLPLPDCVAYRLPDTVSDAMGRPGAIATMSNRDVLHRLIRRCAQVFDTAALDFLDRDPWDRPDIAAIRAESDDFVVSALLPEGVPAALEAIDAILHDARRLGDVMECRYSDEELAQALQLTADPESNRDMDNDSDLYFFWFMQRLQTLLQRARTEGLAVVHARYIWLSAHWEKVVAGMVEALQRNGLRARS